MIGPDGTQSISSFPVRPYRNNASRTGLIIILAILWSGPQQKCRQKTQFSRRATSFILRLRSQAATEYDKDKWLFRLYIYNIIVKNVCKNVIRIKFVVFFSFCPPSSRCASTGSNRKAVAYSMFVAHTLPHPLIVCTFIECERMFGGQSE